MYILEFFTPLICSHPSFSEKSDEMAVSIPGGACESDVCAQRASMWWDGGRAEFVNLTISNTNASQVYIIFTVNSTDMDMAVNSTLFAVIDARNLSISLSHPLQGQAVVAVSATPHTLNPAP